MNPSTASVRLRAICVIHNPSGLFAIPAIWTLRVETSMKKSTTKRVNPEQVQTSTVKKSRRDDLIPVLLQEFFPRCLLDAFRGRRDGVVLQNVRNSRSGDAISKIRQCTLNPQIINDSLLSPIQPTCNRNDEKRKWIKTGFASAQNRLDSAFEPVCAPRAVY